MKGVIFTSFAEFVEEKLGAEVLDEMYESEKISAQGAYTTVGYYPTEELLEMVEHLASKTSTPITALVEEFGQYAFAKLAAQYEKLVESYSSSFECIHHVDQTIHKAVRKLYPDAELPNLHAQISADGKRLDLSYESARPFMHLALGLIKGCAAYFDETVRVEMTDQSGGTGHKAQFQVFLDD